jgi:hypothetical protein
MNSRLCDASETLEAAVTGDSGVEAVCKQRNSALSQNEQLRRALQESALREKKLLSDMHALKAKHEAKVC